MFTESVFDNMACGFLSVEIIQEQNSVKISWYSEIWNTKSWDTFAFLGRFPIHTGPTSPHTPQTMLEACIENFFEF